MIDNKTETPTDVDAIDGYSDSDTGKTAQPDPGMHPKLNPLSPEERAKEEEEIRRDGGAEDLKR